MFNMSCYVSNGKMKTDDDDDDDNDDDDDDDDDDNLFSIKTFLCKAKLYTIWANQQ